MILNVHTKCDFNCIHKMWLNCMNKVGSQIETQNVISNNENIRRVLNCRNKIWSLIPTKQWISNIHMNIKLLKWRISPIKSNPTNKYVFLKHLSHGHIVTPVGHKMAEVWTRKYFQKLGFEFVWSRPGAPAAQWTGVKSHYFYWFSICFLLGTWNCREV